MIRYKHEKGSVNFFITGLITALIVIFCIGLGFFLAVGIMAGINQMTMTELLTGRLENKEQVEEDGEAVRIVETEKSAEEESMPQEDGLIPDEEKETDIVSLEGFNNAVSGVVEKVSPSVVNIKVLINQTDVFGNEQSSVGEGSGIIYQDEGYIITNNHVVAGAEEMSVTLSDGSELKAVLVGRDPNTDIAVIKIEGGGLTAAGFTSIDNIKVGEMAIAIGSPYRLQQTVTVGIISAIGRDIPVSSGELPMVDLVQTDATINPGNSGGPLLNSAGQVVGINSMIFSPSGASAGIGFAIPSDTATNIADQIIEFGRARLPYLGIEIGENTTEILGVYLEKAIPGYPAMQSGLRQGDIITGFNGKEIVTAYDLIAQILRHNVNDRVTIGVYRDGSYFDFFVELVEHPATINS